MTPRGVRKLTELGLKLDGLDAEFTHWRRLSEPRGPLEKQHSQIRATTVALARSLTRLRAELRDEPRTTLDSWAAFEARLLRLHEVWDYFRQKFTLRLVDTFAPYLTVADEFAWACYHPLHERAGLAPDDRREPPLTFLCPAATPYALPRGASYAHEMRLTAAADELRPILAAMPIPVIGLPWFQLQHLPECLLVGHEVGHHAEDDLGLTPTLQSLLDAALAEEGCAAATRSRWRGWLGEVFADVYGTLAGGPAYGQVLADFGDTGPAAAVTSRQYPPIGVRINVVAAALRGTGLAAAADALLGRWYAETSEPLPMGPEGLITPVVNHLLRGPYPQFGGVPLTAVLSFADLQGNADIAAAALLRGYEIPGYLTVRAVVAGAGLAFVADPGRYVAGGATDAVLQHVRAGVESGVRATRTQPPDRRDHLAGERIFELL